MNLISNHKSKNTRCKCSKYEEPASPVLMQIPNIQRSMIEMLMTCVRNRVWLLSMSHTKSTHIVSWKEIIMHIAMGHRTCSLAMLHYDHSRQKSFVYFTDPHTQHVSTVLINACRCRLHLLVVRVRMSYPIGD